MSWTSTSGPILSCRVAIQEQREITHGRQRDLDGSIGARPGPGPAGPRSGGQQRFGERRPPPAAAGRGRRRCGVAPPGGESLGVVGGQRQAPLGEEVLQRPGQRPDRPAGPAGTFQQCLRMIGLLVDEQPTQSA